MSDCQHDRPPGASEGLAGAVRVGKTRGEASGERECAGSARGDAGRGTQAARMQLTTESTADKQRPCDWRRDEHDFKKETLKGEAQVKRGRRLWRRRQEEGKKRLTSRRGAARTRGQAAAAIFGMFSTETESVN